MAVYFIESDGAVKIGVAADAEARLEELQTGNPVTLRLLKVVPGGREIERVFHREFSEFRVRGEWFRLTGALRAFVERDLGAAAVPYRLFAADSPVLGLLGREPFEHSLYRAYCRTPGGTWWQFQWTAGPLKHDPIRAQAAVKNPVKTVHGHLRDLGGYVGDPDRKALQLLLQRAKEIS